MIYCVVPRELAVELHETLRRFYASDPSVEVVIERRKAERRAPERRAGRADRRRRPVERRRIRNAPGRRAGERRASVVAVEPRRLPREARRYADRLSFVEREEPRGLAAEDLDTARLVIRFQGGDGDCFATLYMRYFDRVYTYLRIVLRDSPDAEDAAQQVFLSAYEALPAYERRRQPFRAWLFAVVRNEALSRLNARRRLEPEDPTEVARRRESVRAEPEAPELAWLTDRALVRLIERLPLAQRQVLLLRYMLELSAPEIGEILGRSPGSVRQLEFRALGFLRERLGSAGR